MPPPILPAVIPVDPGNAVAAYNLLARSINAIAGGVKTISAATYTLLAADNYQTLKFTHASGCALTVPVGLGIPFVIGIAQWDDDAVVPTSDGTTVIRNVDGNTDTGGQYSFCGLMGIGGEEYCFFGPTA